jgi:hypothetical protein
MAQQVACRCATHVVRAVVALKVAPAPDRLFLLLAHRDVADGPGARAACLAVAGEEAVRAPHSIFD